jgi:hypothetical protein
MITKDQVDKLARRADRGYVVSPDHEASIVGDEAIQTLARLVYMAAIDDAVRECERLKVEAVKEAYTDAYRHASAAVGKLKEITK